ncbi:MAG: hypothetical protein AB7F35_27050 [Acetobacteraceae bacterium]
MNATYGFVYCGVAGVGLGIFRVTGSELVGIDFAGSKYRGTIIEDRKTGEINLSIEMTVPVGVFLVQGTSPQDLPYIKSASVNVPPNFGDGKPFEVFFAPGPVTLMVRQIPDDYAQYADGVAVNIVPSGPQSSPAGAA